MGERLLVRRAAVLGAGVMGAQIAAHLVNAGVDTVLFDLPAKDGDPDGAPVIKHHRIAIGYLHDNATRHDAQLLARQGSRRCCGQCRKRNEMNNTGLEQIRPRASVCLPCTQIRQKMMNASCVCRTPSTNKEDTPPLRQPCTPKPCAVAFLLVTRARVVS